MPPARSPKILVVGLVVFLVGVAAGVWAWHRENKVRLEELIADVERCAIAIDLADIKALSGARMDVDHPSYLRVKSRLKQLRTVHPTVRFVYVFRYLPESGQVIYLADSEPSRAKDESLPGDVFPEAARMPGLQRILKMGLSSAEGPVEDSFGVFMSAYSRIGTAEERLGPVNEVLGLDVYAKEWRRGLFDAAVRAALYVWLLLGLPVAALMIRSRHIRRQVMIGRLSQAVEQSQNAIAIIGASGLIEYVNSGFCRQTGYAEKELLGQRWLDLHSGSTPPITFERLTARVRAGEVWEGEWNGLRKGGEIYPVRGTLSPVRSEVLDVTGYIAVLVDVSAERRQEAALRMAKEQAEHASKAKSYFWAIMSHEVYTPLNGIAGFSSLLQDTALVPEQVEYVRTIRRSAEALIRLTRDMLDYARIESLGIELEVAPCDVVGLVEDVLDVFSVEAAEKGVALYHGFARDVPGQVITDSGRLRQVLVNLVGNALKFTARGSIEVQVKLAGVAKENAGELLAGMEDGSVELEFSVKDSGVGITSEDRQRLFQPFMQLDEGAARRYGSVGLGLSISKHLVELMGGTIDFASEPGKGSRFYFNVRAARVPDAPAHWPNLAGLRVAVVSGHARQQEEILQVLAHTGAETVVCGLAELTAQKHAFAVVDCAQDDPMLHQVMLHPMWDGERAIGLISPLTKSDVRKVLRRSFRMLLHKPFHQRTLLELMSKTAVVQQSRPPMPMTLGHRVMVISGNDLKRNLVGKILDHLGCEHVDVGAEGLAAEVFSEWRPQFVILRMNEPEWDALALVRHLRAHRDATAGGTLRIIAVTSDTQPAFLKQARAAGVDDFITGPVTLGAVEAALRWRA